ncbi:MAG: MFS transporter [Clostridiales Family XIII bacterium]|jgi:GPH family glycoside/pentoside/hexuronide:cation symporter|nr:MFS transporter [Clostridiales Family XIII bacterium]
MKNPTLLKYAVASGGDSAMYSYVNSFWLFYMTTVSGVPPAAAGSITAIAMVFHAVSGPFFAGISDRSRHKLGRRRPFLIFSSLPLGFILCLMFSRLPFEGSLRVVVLTVLGAAFWIAFAAFFIPHLAWGAEITTDYNERTTIRTLSFVMYAIGAVLGNTAPTAFVSEFGEASMSEPASWQLTTVIVAVISAGSIMFTGIAIRERRPPYETKSLGKFSLKTLALDYWQALKLRPLRLLIYAVVAYMITNTLITADRMYVFTFKLGYSGQTISLIMLVFGALGIALATPVLRLAKRFDKRAILVVCLGVSGCSIFAMRFTDITNLPSLTAFLCIFVVASTSYWQLIPATFYDICEVDEYENRVKRAGTITSILPITEAIASAVGMQILGLWLQFRGFISGAATQTPAALDAIMDCFTIVPGIMLILAALAMFRFPITKRTFEEIKEALNERNAENERQGV